MSQVADIEIGSLRNVLEILRSQTDSMPISPTSVRYRRAVDSLHSSPFTLHPSEDDSSPFTLDSLRRCINDWLVNQWLLQAPYTSASLNLDIVSALYGAAVKKTLLPKTDLFSELKTSLKALGSDGWNSGIDEEIFARALRLTKNAHRLILDDAKAARLVIHSLTHGLIPLREAYQELFARKSVSPNVPRQTSLVKRIVNALFRRARLPQSTDPNQTVEALWAYAALRTGIPASDVVAYLGHAPLGLPVLKLSAPQPPKGGASNSPSGGWGASVGKIFLDNPPRWYAMSLRPGVRFTQVCRRIQLLAPRPPEGGASEAVKAPPSGGRGASLGASFQLFYPCEEIARAIGKKIVVKERPFIHSVVFFKAKLTDIGPLFSKIGDLAWCYRQSAAPGAPYAEISETQFRLFQQTIARFTPDYEVAPAGEMELRPDDRVEIVGGLFAGHEATFVKSEESRVKSEESRVKSEESNTVYRLNIVGDNGIEWRIGVDSRLASKKINH